VFTLAINKPLWDRRIGLGISGTVAGYDFEQSASGTTGNMDVGFGFRPVDFFSFGLAGENILPVPEQLDTPASLRGGIHMNYQDYISGGFDFRYQTEEVYGVAYHVGVGVEGGFKGVRARLGYNFDGVFETHAVTWGIGFENEAGGLEYAMLAPIDGGGGDMVHTFSVRIKAGGIKDMVDELDDEMGGQDPFGDK
jgi:hypothetical protein